MQGDGQSRPFPEILVARCHRWCPREDWDRVATTCDFVCSPGHAPRPRARPRRDDRDEEARRDARKRRRILKIDEPTTNEKEQTCGRPCKPLAACRSPSPQRARLLARLWGRAAPPGAQLVEPATPRRETPGRRPIPLRLHVDGYLLASNRNSPCSFGLGGLLGAARPAETWAPWHTSPTARPRFRDLLRSAPRLPPFGRLPVGARRSAGMGQR